jgi:hypothetical protein
MSHNVPTSDVAPGDSNQDIDPAEQLNERQLKAIPLILAGSTNTAVAAAIGVDRRTIYRWRMYDLAFGTELTLRRRELYQNCVDRMYTLLHSAMEVLERHVKEKYAPTAHRAARTILSLSGVGKAVASAIAPVKKQTPSPQPTGAPSELSPRAIHAMTKAIDAMDMLGLRPSSQAG